MATRKKDRDPAEQSGYSTTGLDSREKVEQALAGADYTPGAQVNKAQEELQQWQTMRPEEYRSNYRDQIDQLLGQLLDRESFRYDHRQDPLYRQYENTYTQNAYNAGADAAAQAAALTGGYGSSYATSAAQQAYQQQMNLLSGAIPTLYDLALDTYNSGGDTLLNRLDQLNAQEQSDQTRYDKELADYYTQLDQKGQAYNSAYDRDYGQYQDYLTRLDTLYNYYSGQEQAQAAQRQQRFNNALAVLGVLGDMIQLGISGTTGLGSTFAGLANAGYNIYAGNRAYEADRADAQWSQQMQEKQRQDKLDQQRYENESSQRAYEDALRQQAFNNNIATEKLNIAKGQWALKQSDAKQKASRAAAGAEQSTPDTTAAASSSGSSGSGKKVGVGTVPFTATYMRSRGKSDVAIADALRKEGYSASEIGEILRQLR